MAPARRPWERRVRKTWVVVLRHVLFLRRRLLVFVALAAAPFLALHAGSIALSHANSLGRRCGASSSSSSNLGRIAMVSFAAPIGSGMVGRSFHGVMEVAGRNKRAYSTKMGYHFIDAAGLVDSIRPPSWSKIRAVRSLLPTYDWVFWNDADTIVTNPEIRLEQILLSVIGHGDFQSSPDLVVTEDVNGVNAGVLFVKRSNWSEVFLDTWWNQTAFIRKGSTKSGDNAALKHLIGSLPAQEFLEHVHIASMQCLFNSYPWFPSLKSAYRLILSPRTVWKGAYSEGDFMVHFAGLDDKQQWAAKILKEMRV